VRNKIWVIAGTELGQLVRAKAFLVSLILLPLFMLGSIAVQAFARRSLNDKARRIAVIEPSGATYEVLEEVVLPQWSAAVAAAGEDSAGPRIELERAELEGRDLDELRLELSDRVRKEELFGFLELPEDPGAAEAKIRYYTSQLERLAFTQQVETMVNVALRIQRYQARGLSLQDIASLERKIPQVGQGLFTRGPDGKIEASDRTAEAINFGVPIILVVMLILLVSMSTQPLLSTVLEEKMSRISEVLLGSATPFELMMGKLLGTLGGSLILVGLYVGCGLGAAAYMGYLDAVPPFLIGAFLLFVLPAVLLFGSIYLAVGAACNDFKDAQSLLTPMLLFLMAPMMMLSTIIEAPSGNLAVGLSLFPTSAPFVMLLRIGLLPALPLWQPVLALSLSLLTAFLMVLAAGKIFRVGLLMQGKAPSFGQMIRWIWAR
jgi:ABC-2 type transport system permease protein